MKSRAVRGLSAPGYVPFGPSARALSVARFITHIDMGMVRSTCPKAKSLNTTNNLYIFSPLCKKLATANVNC